MFVVKHFMQKIPVGKIISLIGLILTLASFSYDGDAPLLFYGLIAVTAGGFVGAVEKKREADSGETGSKETGSQETDSE